jgi:RNA polymerase sigma-70 factor, ECF subfamily
MTHDASSEINTSPANPLPAEVVEDCYRLWATGLQRYAWAILRDHSLAADAVQNAFLIFARSGGNVQNAARKSWLNQVVYREALRIREKELRRPHQSMVSEPVSREPCSPLDQLQRNEDTAELKQLIEKLPDDQQRILQMRIVQEKTFREIATELNIPLGTALSRMRIAVERLKEHYHDREI